MKTSNAIAGAVALVLSTWTLSADEPQRPGQPPPPPGSGAEPGRPQPGGDRREGREGRPLAGLFQLLDANHDGAIDATELAEGLKKFDKNGDGKITPDEFHPLGGPPRRDGDGAGRDPRDGDGQRGPGPRDGDDPGARGPRDGEGQRGPGPRDGDGPRHRGPRDGGRRGPGPGGDRPDARGPQGDGSQGQPPGAPPPQARFQFRPPQGPKRDFAGGPVPTREHHRGGFGGRDGFAPRGGFDGGRDFAAAVPPRPEFGFGQQPGGFAGMPRMEQFNLRMSPPAPGFGQRPPGPGNFGRPPGPPPMEDGFEPREDGRHARPAPQGPPPFAAPPPPRPSGPRDGYRDGGFREDGPRPPFGPEGPRRPAPRPPGPGFQVEEDFGDDLLVV